MYGNCNVSLTRTHAHIEFLDIHTSQDLPETSTVHTYVYTDLCTCACGCVTNIDIYTHIH